MILVPFLPVHLAALDVQSAQVHRLPNMSLAEYGKTLDQSGMSWTATDGGEVMGCGGVCDMGDGRGLSWALLSERCRGPKMIQATRLTLKQLKQYPFRRIEAIVADGHEAGHKWARIMGYTLETPGGMKAWFDDGSTAFLYSRVQ
jgi:hypothetical protein